MRKFLKLLFAVFTVTAILTSCFDKDFISSAAALEKDRPSDALKHIINPDSEVRGVWIASVYNIDYPSRADLTADELKSEIDAILDTCEKNRLNTVFFQVRPACDALYDSDIFPVSKFISSEGKLVFDPLEYIVSEAHQRNIFIHAWVNPLRVTMNTTDLSTLDDKSPAKNHPEWVVEYADGKLYLNAGVPEVADLVVDGVREIVSKYDVDGIVFDDYFYPYPAYGEDGAIAQFDDQEEYEKYGSGFDNVADWRRNNINKIIKSVYDTVHGTDPECVFGVSPFAIWQNDNGENGGSKTVGLEGYSSLYCDAVAWIDGGYIDYISPQIYWKFSDPSCPFDVLTRWWNTKLEGSGVKLYVSHASYRYEEGEWDSPAGQISEQISFARSEKYYHGSICYGYDEINRNTNGISDELQKIYADDIIYTEIQSNSQPISISAPANGSVMNTPNTFILGSSDPFYTLTMDGNKVGRTKSGCFNLYVELKEGENTFLFEENGELLEYKLTYKPDTAAIPAPETKPEPLSLDHLSVVNTYPSKNVATREDKIYVSCTAPADGKVEVNIGGIVTKLEEAKPDSRAKDGYTGTTYSGYASLPEVSDGDITDCGQMKFTLTHKDGTVTADGASVQAMGKNAFIKVRVKEDYTNLKITQNSSYYNDYTVQSAGMTEYAVSLSGGYYLLRMGGHISENDVEVMGKVVDIGAGMFSSAKVTNAGRNTEFALATSSKPAYNGCIDENGRFVVTFYAMDSVSAPVPEISANPILKSCEVVRLDDRVRYSFELYAVENFYGFDLYYADDAVVVTLRNPMVIDLEKEKPLEGVDIVLDAGHGGEDRGAAGAVSADSGTASLHEKDLNLKLTLAAAERLLALGANVSLTREEDVTSDLYQRMDYLEEKEPDLCVSLHQNSMGYSTDVTRVRGTLALWCMDSGLMLSDSVGKSVANSLGRLYRGAQYQALAMCRNPKFPQALIEVGFITSVEEYEQLLSDNGIAKAADGIAEGILDWFARQSEYAVPKSV